MEKKSNLHTKSTKHTVSVKASLLLLASLLVVACNRSVYVYDGVTDGDTFYLAQTDTTDNYPARQSWVTYSLGRSACKLRMGGKNPARNSSFDCEFTARKLLIKSWRQQLTQSPRLSEPYLDDLALITNAGFLREYVWHYFHRRNWRKPHDLRSTDFRLWQRKHLPRHKTETRLTGSWGFGPAPRSGLGDQKINQS